MEELLKDSPRRWDRLAELVTRNTPKPTLVPATDKRAPAPALAFEEVRPFDDGSDLI